MNIRRTVAVLAAAVVAGAGVSLVVQQSPAAAHGAMVYPPTRTYACYVDGLAGGGGDINPTNPACREAVAIGGKQPFWDWFGVLIGNAAGRHREIIPDGTLCGAGTTKFAGLNLARTDWPTTNVQSGQSITFRYNGWAPHPGRWSQYITRDGWNPSQPLKWSDLEPAPFDDVLNPPLRSGATGAEYVWQARLPVKQGRHIIYSIWQRTDSPEAFYNCSDVNFGGTQQSPDPGTSPSADPGTSPSANPGTSPSANPGTSPSANPGTSPSANPGSSGCVATYKMNSAWPGGFNASVTVRNPGTSAIRGWKVDWTFANGERVTSLWSGNVTSSGQSVSVTNAGHNGGVAANWETTFGFIGTPGASTPGTPALTCTAS
ncbi:MAG TPA: lytic polysaccharide monooxygenase [Pilimelia sp.]|nr:lytic polysaccharide monooxygenase [Pilimelia sp.]